jgi:polyhydroxyalkanoate synthase
MLQHLIAAFEARPAHRLDRHWHAVMAQSIMPLSPGSTLLALSDWLTHLAMDLAEQGALLMKGVDLWRSWPFNLLYQAFLLQQKWWHGATLHGRGAHPHHLKLVNFLTRQTRDVVAPANFLLTNPRGAEAYPVGVRVAITPGNVVFRNALIELIQYTPTTQQVQPEPVRVKFLVEHGYTVFMSSWINPGPALRATGLDDYRRLGGMATLKADEAIVPGQVAYLEDLMWERGYLGGARMSSAFFFLRSLDLIWSRHVQSYLLGQPGKSFDVMAWSADTTNLPSCMHSQYLRQFYLNNDLVEGRFDIDDEPVMLLDIRVPIFTIGTTRDWHDGSWWPAWEAWLKQRSGKPVPPPPPGAPEAGYPQLGPAPGTYLFGRSNIT